MASKKNVKKETIDVQRGVKNPEVSKLLPKLLKRLERNKKKNVPLEDRKKYDGGGKKKKPRKR